MLEELEEKLVSKLNPLFKSFNSFCRGALTRREAQKMKVRDVAIRCIQKNVRKLLAVRNWSWWKIYQQLSPLTLVESSVQKLQCTLVRTFCQIFRECTSLSTT